MTKRLETRWVHDPYEDTPDLWIANVKAALEAWNKVSPGLVDLSSWRCGTHACFGGWLPTFDYFHKLGVHARPSGQPYIMLKDGREVQNNFEVSSLLFGDPDMFATGQFEEKWADTDAERISDWEIIRRRLQKRLAELEAAWTI